MKRAALGALFLTVLTLVIANAAPAQAHTGLVSSEPADGTVLASAPADVVLAFDEAVLEAAVTISDVHGTVVSSPNSGVVDTTVTVPWPKGLPDGSYAVNYRVVSTDGHPVDGSIALAFGAGVTLDPAVQHDHEEAGSSLPVLAIGAGLVIGAGIGLFYAARRRSRPAV